MTSDPVLKSKPEEFDTHSGVAREDRLELANQLSEALANTYLLYLKTQGFHWNVVGPLFYDLHKLTEAQYEDLAEAIDKLAERIRAIGFTAPGSFSQYTQVASIQEEKSVGQPIFTAAGCPEGVKYRDVLHETGTPTAEEMIRQLAEGNEICSRKMRRALAEAERVEDVNTAHLLTDRIGQHEENSWMLRALLA